MRLLVLGHNDWWVWREQGFASRNGALARELATRPQVERVLVVDTPRWRARTHRPREHAGDDATPVAEHIVAVRWSYPLPLPADRRWARRLNESLSGPGLRRRVTAALGSGGPVVAWVADPRLVGPALSLPHDCVWFDAIDDWRHHAWAGRDAVESGYRLAAAAAQMVTGVSAAALAQTGLDEVGEVLPNALDPTLWRTLPRAASTPERRRPVIGYVGVIQERVDLPLVAAVAERLPQATFLIGGPLLHGAQAGQSSLPPNVRLVGPVAREELPGWLCALDACFVPHRRDAFTASMDPLKMYEYLAAGRPVVSTVPSPNPVLAPFVDVADGASSVADSLARAIACDDEARRSRRRTVALTQTWSERADVALRRLTELLPADHNSGGADSGGAQR